MRLGSFLELQPFLLYECGILDQKYVTGFVISYKKFIWFLTLILHMQFSGINGVLYYTPQILEKAGVGILLSNLGVSSSSASLLISGLTTLLMLPAIAVAMRLMDISGRR